MQADLALYCKETISVSASSAQRVKLGHIRQLKKCLYRLFTGKTQSVASLGQDLLLIVLLGFFFDNYDQVKIKYKKNGMEKINLLDRVVARRIQVNLSISLLIIACFMPISVGHVFRL